MVKRMKGAVGCEEGDSGEHHHSQSVISREGSADDAAAAVLVS